MNVTNSFDRNLFHCVTQMCEQLLLRYVDDQEEEKTMSANIFFTAEFMYRHDFFYCVDTVHVTNNNLGFACEFEVAQRFSIRSV